MTNQKNETKTLRLFWRTTLIFFSLCLWLPSHGAHAEENYIYRSKNKIDFVKMDKAKKNEVAEGLNHPHTFTPEEIKSILRSLHFSKKILLVKDIEDRQIFDDSNIDFLTPYLVEAFQKANSRQVVVVSYFTRDVKFAIQNDRLTVFRAFLKNDGLHLKFTKVYAKLLGDRGTTSTAEYTQRSRGANVSLELQPGQNRISWKPEEIVVDTHFYAQSPERKVEKNASVQKSAKKAEKKETKPSSIKDRLRELDQLKKDELITEKEYQDKKAQLLREL